MNWFHAFRTFWISTVTIALIVLVSLGVNSTFEDVDKPQLLLRPQVKEILPQAPLEIEIVLKNGGKTSIVSPSPFEPYYGFLTIFITSPSGKREKFRPEGRPYGFTPINEEDLPPGNEKKYTGHIFNGKTLKWFSETGLYQLVVEYSFRDNKLSSETSQVKVSIPDSEKDAHQAVEKSNLSAFFSLNLEMYDQDLDAAQWKSAKDFVSRFPMSGYVPHIRETLNRYMSLSYFQRSAVDAATIKNIVVILADIGDNVSGDVLKNLRKSIETARPEVVSKEFPGILEDATIRSEIQNAIESIRKRMIKK